jgi:hypothetical protein
VVTLKAFCSKGCGFLEGSVINSMDNVLDVEREHNRKEHMNKVTPTP